MQIMIPTFVVAELPAQISDSECIDCLSTGEAILVTLLPLINQPSLPTRKELEQFMVSSAPGINPAVLAAVESTNAEERLS